MTKQQLIKAICKAQGKNANPAFLNTKTVAQLKETYSRWVAVSQITQKEINDNCDLSFIRGQK